MDLSLYEYHKVRGPTLFYIIFAKFLHCVTQARFSSSFSEYFLFNYTKSVKEYLANARYIAAMRR